jgi:hypothetical protein
MNGTYLRYKSATSSLIGWIFAPSQHTCSMLHLLNAIAAGLFRQLPRTNSIQYRSSLTVRNGPGGSWTHDRSTGYFWKTPAVLPVLKGQKKRTELNPHRLFLPIFSLRCIPLISLYPFILSSYAADIETETQCNLRLWWYDDCSCIWSIIFSFAISGH